MLQTPRKVQYWCEILNILPPVTQLLITELKFTPRSCNSCVWIYPFLYHTSELQDLSYSITRIAQSHYAYVIYHMPMLKLYWFNWLFVMFTIQSNLLQTIFTVCSVFWALYTMFRTNKKMDSPDPNSGNTCSYLTAIDKTILKFLKQMDKILN